MQLLSTAKKKTLYFPLEMNISIAALNKGLAVSDPLLFKILLKSLLFALCTSMVGVKFLSSSIKSPMTLNQKQFICLQLSDFHSHYPMAPKFTKINRDSEPLK